MTDAVKSSMGMPVASSLAAARVVLGCLFFFLGGGGWGSGFEFGALGFMVSGGRV